MFAYCLNDPVNFSDEDGEYADDYAGWGGQEIGIFLYEWITGENHPAHEARELEEEIIAAQAGIIAGATESLWDAYQHNIELEAEAQYRQHMETKAFIEDRFSAPEKAVETFTAVALALEIAEDVCPYPKAKAVLKVCKYVAMGFAAIIPLLN